MEEVILAAPRGFCAGVERAIAIVERALVRYGAPIYVRHEVVHNRSVVEDLRARGVVFIEELSEAPDDAVVVFSAHGVARTVRDEAGRRKLAVFDATCPLVTKVHNEVVRLQKRGIPAVLIGHAGHPEVIGTIGQVAPESETPFILVESVADVAALPFADGTAIGCVMQTTLSLDDTAAIVAALQQRFVLQLPAHSDICYATQNRQEAVKALVNDIDLLLVVGSRTSSNSNRLREIAQNAGVTAYLIDGPDEIDPTWCQSVTRVGVTAGASAPEHVVRAVLSALRRMGARTVREHVHTQEVVQFPLPKLLRRA